MAAAAPVFHPTKKPKSLGRRMVLNAALQVLMAGGIGAVASYLVQRDTSKKVDDALSAAAHHQGEDLNLTLAKLLADNKASEREILRTDAQASAGRLARSVSSLLQVDFAQEGLDEACAGAIGGATVWAAFQEENGVFRSNFVGDAVCDVAGLSKIAKPADVLAALTALESKGSVLLVRVPAEAKCAAILAVDLSAADRKDAQIAARVKKIEEEVHRDADVMLAEVRAKIEAGGNRTIFWLLAVLAVTQVVAFLMARSFSRKVIRQVEATGGVVSGLAANDLTGQAEVFCDDELGAMATKLNAAVTSLAGTVKGIATEAAAVDASSKALERVGVDLNKGSDGLSAQAASASQEARETSKGAVTIAGGIEELGATTNEISKSVQQAASKTGSAVGSADQAAVSMKQLVEASAKIDAAVELIGKIAAQTNLLALNATIEAARAGEAGRGFAVVASEVKGLARQSAAAAEEIGRTVAAVRTKVGDADAAIVLVAAAIADINKLQQSIAAAVEEQSATTQQLAKEVSGVSLGVDGMAKGAVHVAEESDKVRSASQKIAAAVEELARFAKDLQAAAAKFKC